MILVASATEKEIYYLKAKNKNQNVIFLTTGVGVLNTSFYLQQFLYKNQNKIDKIIFAGIGGGFLDSKIDIGDLCIANEEIFGDFGVCFQNKIDYIFQEPANIKIENKLMKGILNNFSFDFVGSFITVNCVTTIKERIDFFYEKFNPVCENMEGYAAAFIAKKFKCEFAEIRTISNFVGMRDGWEMEKAIERLNVFMLKLLESI